MALDPLINYYQRELTYLRRASTEFAKKHPKIARRLEVGYGDSSDPHVERLIESFAYLTAGLQREIDDQFPRVTNTLLGVLYPHLVNPVPSMAIAQFKVDPNQGRHTSGYAIERDNPVFSRTQEGDLCQFRTCYGVELWPIEVSEAEIIQKDSLPYDSRYLRTSRILRIRLKTLTEPFSKLGGPKKLRFYIDGNRALQNILYEVLFTAEGKVAVLPNAAEMTDFDQAKTILAGPIMPVGFDNDEYVIPSPAPSHPAYRLLQEYFIFPNKFLFFDIDNIPCFQCENSLDLLIEIPDKIKLGPVNVDQKAFLLGCTPIINLFSKISEPLNLDYRSHEYRLVADYRRELITEIHSIKQLQYIEEEGMTPKTIAPYFSFSHYEQTEEQPVFWFARRVETISKDMPGTDLYLSFVDYNFRPEMPATKTVYAQIMCTNRELAFQMPKGATMESEYPVPLTVTCIEKPTKQAYPPQEGETQWRLISQLSLNHLPLSGDEHALKAFKEILFLYATLTEEKVFHELEALIEIKPKRIVRRMVEEAWRGFSQGTAVELTFKPEAFGAGGALLFSMVINEFLALYSAVNSFVELSIKRKDQEGVWKTWKPNRGDTFLL